MIYQRTKLEDLSPAKQYYFRDALIRSVRINDILGFNIAQGIMGTIFATNDSIVWQATSILKDPYNVGLHEVIFKALNANEAIVLCELDLEKLRPQDHD